MFKDEAPKFIRIAKNLYAEKIMSISRSVFDDVVSSVISKEGVNLVSKKPNKGCFEVNGLMRDIRRSLKPIQRKYKNEYKIYLDNKTAQERKRALIEIRPVLPQIPDRAKAQYDESGKVKFVNGPFKGEEVVWSSRLEEGEIPQQNEIQDDIFIIEPDKYRATFYGWKRKY